MSNQDSQYDEVDRTASGKNSNLYDSELRNGTVSESVICEIPPSTIEEIMSFCNQYFTNSPVYHGFCYVYFFNPNCGVSDIVMECLTNEQMMNMRTDFKRKDAVQFYEDVNINSLERVTLDDYKNSKYAKGHLAAASNHKYNRNAYNSTFCLSNIAPMHLAVNDIIQKMEKQAQGFLKTHGKVHIFTGTYFNPDRDPVFVKENSRVRVPDEFFKAIFLDKPLEPENKRTKLLSYSYMLENRRDIDVNLEKARISLPNLMKKTGLNFLNKVTVDQIHDAKIPGKSKSSELISRRTASGSRRPGL